MADLYFPNPIAALPTPQFQEPQSNTGIVAMGSALQALSSVANNFRTKQMNVQKASQMADALEREGLTQEAGLYRAAAENYQTNFFATPEENERFNQSLLNDTLRLLTNKQEREMKAQQLQLETQYKQALIQNQLADAGLSEERLKLSRQEADIRKDELTERRAERDEDRRIRMEGQQTSAIKSNIDTIQEELTRTRAESDDVIEQYRKGLIPKSEAEERGKNLRIKDITLQKALSDNRRQLSVSAGVPFIDTSIPITPFAVPKTYSEVDAEYEALAKKSFVRNPLLKSVTYIVEGKRRQYENRDFRGQGMARISRKTLPDGTEVEEEVYSEPVPAGQRGGGRYGTPSGLPAGKLDTSALKGG